jgi:nicotinamidase-related amidase
MAVERMVQAGAHPITTWAYVSELQRDWARAATAEQVHQIVRGGAAALGQGLLWEWDLLNLKVGTR